MAYAPAELAERRHRPRRVSGVALRSPRVLELLTKHYPDLITPPRVSQKALHDPRAIELLAEHCPEFVVDRPKPIIDTAALRARRIATGLTLTEFAMGAALSEPGYRNIEVGNKNPSEESLARIARQLGCEPSELRIAEAA